MCMVTLTVGKAGPPVGMLHMQLEFSHYSLWAIRLKLSQCISQHCLFIFCILNVASRFIIPPRQPRHPALQLQLLLLLLQLCTCNSGCKKRLHFAVNRGIKWAASATTSTSKYTNEHAHTQTQANEYSSAHTHIYNWRIRIKNSVRRTLNRNPANESNKYVLTVLALCYLYRQRWAYELESTL